MKFLMPLVYIIQVTIYTVMGIIQKVIFNTRHTGYKKSKKCYYESTKLSMENKMISSALSFANFTIRSTRSTIFIAAITIKFVFLVDE